MTSESEITNLIEGVPCEVLLPCPFCGNAAQIVNIEEGENAGGSCVECTHCQASSNVEFEFKENFVNNWNRRVRNGEADVERVAVTDEMVERAYVVYRESIDNASDPNVQRLNEWMEATTRAGLRAAITAALSGET